MKVIFATPSLSGPTKHYLDSLEASLPLLEAAGWEHGYAQQIKCPYISAARANLTRAALDVLKDPQDVIVYLDYDLSWDPPDLLKLIQTEGDVVSGTYRPKIDDEQYMGSVEAGIGNRPIVRASDGAIKANLIPAGFLKVTLNGIDKFMVEYPELCYGPMYHLSVDLFNHGVYNRIWWGEDYTFARRWREKCGDIWLVPNLNLTHWEWVKPKDAEGYWKPYPGNYHKYLLRCPGGSESKNPERIVNFADSPDSGERSGEPRASRMELAGV